MNTKLKTIALATGLALGAIAPSAWSANGVLFDRAGTAGATESNNVQSIQFADTNVLVRNTVGTGSAPTGIDPINPVIYAQGKLSSFQTGGENALGNSEFTFQLQVAATRSPSDPTMSWLDKADTTSFFRLFYDPSKDANSTTGCGFGTTFAAPCSADSSVQILQGSITITAANLTQNNTAVTGPNGGPLSLLDQFPGTTTEANDNQAHVYTVSMTGAMTLHIVITTYDKNFFLTDPTNTTLDFDMTLADQLVSPFSATDPSNQVVGNLIEGSAANLNSTYGPAISIDHDNNPATPKVLRRLNDLFPNFGATCAAGGACDVHVQGAPNISFNAEFVPEPNTLALLGLAMLGFGFTGRRLSRKS